MNLMPSAFGFQGMQKWSGLGGLENLRFQACFKEASEIAGKDVEQGEIRPRESNADFVGSLMEI